jgi:hypothetical protein
MFRYLFCLLAVLLLLPVNVSFAVADENKPATDAARQWVSLIDQGQYAESWEKASELFRESIAKPDWEESLKMVRAPLGAVVSREVKNTARVTSLPGAPEGFYVIAEFDTSFQNKAGAIETITMSRQDNKWLVGGYYIR